MQYQPSSPASSLNDHDLLMTSTKKRKVGVPKFLRYLYQILDKEDPSIISWANSGTSIQILDTDRVAQYILPKYFKHSKYASFQRQLNYFGFRKWTKSQTNICTFSHPEFRQNRPDRLHLIKRKNSPESSRKKISKSIEKSTNLQHFQPQFQNTYRHPVPMNFDFLTPPGTSSPSSAGFHRNFFPTDMFDMNGKKELFPKQTSSPSTSHLMSDIENLHIQS
ncbi:HSF-type DNA-binding protein, partial [Thraustotheca clavata]